MIHQFIYAGPRPGWPAERFQNYWLQEHSIRYAAKIQQIRQYLVGPRQRLNLPNEVPFFEAVAEIWLKDPAEQLASLESVEFLKGARADEPNWAAFWQTFVHESYSELVKGQVDASKNIFKVYLFLRRRNAANLEDFRQTLRGTVREAISAVPGLTLHISAPARDELYGFGEPRLDAIEVLGFSAERDVLRAKPSREWAGLFDNLNHVAESRYFFTFAARENWIIRPGDRP
jgi:hypothetical protein